MKVFFAFILLVGISYATDPCENGVCPNDYELGGVLKNWADSKGDDARDTMKPDQIDLSDEGKTDSQYLKECPPYPDLVKEVEERLEIFGDSKRRELDSNNQLYKLMQTCPGIEATVANVVYEWSSQTVELSLTNALTNIVIHVEPKETLGPEIATKIVMHYEKAISKIKEAEKKEADEIVDNDDIVLDVTELKIEIVFDADKKTVVSREMPIESWKQSGFLENVIADHEEGELLTYLNYEKAFCQVKTEITQKCNAWPVATCADDTNCAPDATKCKVNQNTKAKCKSSTDYDEEYCEIMSERPLKVEAETLKQIFVYMEAMGDSFQAAEKLNNDGGCFPKPLKADSQFTIACEVFQGIFDMLKCRDTEKCGKLLQQLNVMNMPLPMTYVAEQLAEFVQIQIRTHKGNKV